MYRYDWGEVSEISIVEGISWLDILGEGGSPEFLK